MNLHFHPVVLFENCWPFPTDDLKDMRWSIDAEPIGRHDFDIAISCNSPFKVVGDRNYLEFSLSKEAVPFQYDDYPCQIFFSATLDSPHFGATEIDCRFFGVVKSIWSRGLR